MTKSSWSSPKQFGLTQTMLDKPKLLWSHRRTKHNGFVVNTQLINYPDTNQGNYPDTNWTHGRSGRAGGRGRGGRGNRGRGHRGAPGLPYI